MWSLFCFNSTDGTWRWTCLHVRTLLQAVCGLPVHCITNTVCNSSETVFIISAGIGICHQIIKLLKPFQSVVIVTLYPTWSHTVQHSRPLQVIRPFSNTAFYFNYLFLQKFLGLLASWTSSIIWYLEQYSVPWNGSFSSSIEKWGSCKQNYSPRFTSVLGYDVPVGLRLIVFHLTSKW